MAPETKATTGNPLSTEALSAPPRLVLILALLRSLLSVVVLVTIYFRLPLSNLSESRTIIEFVIGLLHSSSLCSRVKRSRFCARRTP